MDLRFAKALVSRLPPHLEKIPLAAAPGDVSRGCHPGAALLLPSAAAAAAARLEVVPVLDGDLLEHLDLEHVDAHLGAHLVPDVGERELVPRAERLQLVEQQAGEEVAGHAVPPDDDRRVWHICSMATRKIAMIQDSEILDGRVVLVASEDGTACVINLVRSVEQEDIRINAAVDSSRVSVRRLHFVPDGYGSLLGDHGCKPLAQ